MSNTAVQTLTLPITGMSCAACSAYIEQTLNALPGVQSASVNLLANQATITSSLPPSALVTAIQQAGYDATLPSADLEAAAPETPETHLALRAVTALVIAGLSMLLGMTHLPVTPLHYTLLALSLVVMVVLSPETYRRALKAARHRTTNMSTLVAIGTLAALAWSLTATLMPRIFTAHGLAPDVYYEAIDFILAFLLLGAWLDSRAKLQTQSALAAFAQLTPSTARVLRDSTDGLAHETVLPIADLHPGDHILLRPGERIPVDGLVLDGSSSVDEALLTGESHPVLKDPGSSVIGGTINLDGPLTIQATTLGADSVLSQLRRLLSAAQTSRAPMQKLADRASTIFVPSVLALAALTFAVWLAIPALQHQPLQTARAFAAAIAVLVIACPCAMGLAVPAALTVGIGRAAQLGILVKNGEALERLALTRNLALDKTGTLTEGRPRIIAAHFAPHLSPDKRQHLLQLAAALEQSSEHPLARAVQTFVPAHPRLTLTDVRIIPGQGVTALHSNQRIAIGNASLVLSARVENSSSDSYPGTGGFEHPASADCTPATHLHLSVDGIRLLTLEATDTVRDSASAALRQLSALNITPHILTGDNAQAAAAIAHLLGIPASATHAQLLPAGKLAIIEALQQQAPTAMAGDGLNDAAALAQADTGIAISGQTSGGQATGTDLTREAADLILLRPDLTLIPTAIRLARHTTRVMRQNLGWAIGYNLLGLPVAAGVLYPHLHLLLSPALGSAAMALSSLSVLFNSLRLRNFA